MKALSVSLVTPNLNYAWHLGHTLDSVLSQEYPDLSYVVVDGGSTDDSEAIFTARAQGRARWISASGAGQYESINLGFAEAQGEIMGWLNSDDIYFPWTLRAVAEIFQTFPEVDWIMGAPSVIQNGVVQSVRPLRPLDRESVRLGLLSGGESGLIQQESCFWRRGLWERAGGLDPGCGLAADFELWMRFAQHAEPVACSALLGGFSVHGNNRSLKNADRYQTDMQGAIDKLSSADTHQRNVRQGAVLRYQRWKKWPGLKRLSRSLGRLSDVVGSVIRRDVSTSTYGLTRERIYP